MGGEGTGGLNGEKETEAEEEEEVDEDRCREECNELFDTEESERADASERDCGDDSPCSVDPFSVACADDDSGVGVAGGGAADTLDEDVTLSMLGAFAETKWLVFISPFTSAIRFAAFAWILARRAAACSAADKGRSTAGGAVGSGFAGSSAAFTPPLTSAIRFAEFARMRARRAAAASAADMEAAGSGGVDDATLF